MLHRRKMIRHQNQTRVVRKQTVATTPMMNYNKTAVISILNNVKKLGQLRDYFSTGIYQRFDRLK